MDVSESSMRGDVDCRKPRLIHTSETPVSHHNGHPSTINLSYQIVLQDHNYGAPPPTHNSESSAFAQCKQEPVDSVHVSCAQYTPGHHSQRGGLKTFTPRSSHGSPQSGRGPGKANGINPSLLAKRQRVSSGSSNGVAYSPHSVTPPGSGPSRRPVPHGGETPKSSLTTPPLIPKVPLGSYPYPGDLNSHLYASTTTGDKVSATPTPVNGSSGFPSYLSARGGSPWYTHGNGGSQRDRFKDEDEDDDDSNGSLDSPRMGTESDHEGEETETAPECEDEEDERLERERDRDRERDREQPQQYFDESVTRCICKFGHDDGYMICCDRCSVWQHVDCMNLDRNNIPDEFMCELCQPRRVDRARARAIQYRKRQEFRLSTPPPSGLGSTNRRERSKDNRSKNDDFVDVEKTPKKFQRTSNPVGAKMARGGGANRNPGGVARSGDALKSGKRAAQQTKFKRRGDKPEESAQRKKKMFRSKSSEMIDVGGPSSSTAENSPAGGRNHPNGELLLQWIEHYEEAVTNHYSPELRARVSAVRPNGLQSNEFLSLSLSPPSYRLASKAGGFKTLVASSPINRGSPVIECRGKYMLASQLRPYKTGDGPGSATSTGLRPTPHVIHHLLQTSSPDNASPAPALEICVDGRSYGNETRFVWQSCQPNAEVKHKVEKGSVHLYLVAKTEILDSEEITVAHDIKNPLPCPYEGCPHMRNKDGGGRTGLAPTTPATSTAPGTAANAATPTTAPASSPAELDRSKRRVRRRTSSTAPTEAPSPGTTLTSPAALGALAPNQADSPSAPPPAPAAAPPTPPTPSVPPPTPVKRSQRTPSKASVVTTEGEDSQDGVTTNHTTHDEVDGTADHESSKRKLSREERKMEAIMKAFERMEKQQQRRQETLAKTTHRKDSRDGREDKDEGADDVDHSPPPSTHPGGQPQSEKRAGMAGQEPRTKSFKRGKRGGRLRRSSSGAGISENSRIRMRALSGEVHSGHSATEEESEHGGSSSPGQGHAGNHMDDPSTITAFKCPKTKKVVFNNWSGDGSEVNGVKGEPGDSLGGPNSLPLSLSVPVCYMRNPNPRSPTRPFRTAHLRPSTLASLKSPAGSASPDPHGEGGHSNDENAWTAPLPGSGGPGGSAKKRWLRQAISEETETETPNSVCSVSGIGGGVGGVGMSSIIPAGDGLDHVTPLKKRRLARASMSSETSFTPPSTPTPSNTLLLGGISENCSTPNESIAVPMDEGVDNSQSTPPECDDAPVQSATASAGPSSPGGPLSQESTTPYNDPASESSSQPSWYARTDESSQSSEAPSVGAETAVSGGCVDATAVLLQGSSYDGDVFSPSASRPTWEFRAPDAQFMRQCNRTAPVAGEGPESACMEVTSSPSMDTATPTCPVAEPTTPKPVKRKLSILEYRQRKQVATTDGTEPAGIKNHRDSATEDDPATPEKSPPPCHSSVTSSSASAGDDSSTVPSC